MIGKLVRCVTCNEVMNITEWDSYPEYVWNDGDMEEIHVDDTEVFFQRHKGDQLEVLTPVSAIISNKPYVEPVKDCYFEATNGTERFLIKKWRNSIDQPFTYKIISGRLEISTEKMLVQVEAIRKQIRMENNLHISDEKLDSFIKTVKEETERLSPENLELSAEGDTPLLSYHRLNDESVRLIFEKCEQKFEQHELQWLKGFMFEHNTHDDVMTLIVKKKFSIKPEVSIATSLKKWLTAKKFVKTFFNK